MAVRGSVFENPQIGFETTYGTAVAATRKFQGTSISPRIMSESNTHRPNGQRLVTTGIQNREWTEADISMPVMQYTDPVYWLAMMLGSPDITTPGGATAAREHLFTMPQYTEIVPKSGTIETGSYVRASEFPGAVVKSLSAEFLRSGISMAGSVLGQRTTDGITMTAGANEIQTITASGTVSGGTYTLTFKGETTSALNHDANNAAILAALNALPNIDSGDVVIGGGALPTTPVTITFGGKYASVDVPLIVVDDALLTGSTPAYGIAETTPGASLSQVAQVPTSGNHWNFYLDASAANLGNTQYEQVYRASWSISDIFGPDWPGNRSKTSFSNIVNLAPGTEFSFRAMADATGMGNLTSLRNGDKIFARIEAIGGEVESGQDYEARFDICSILTGISPWEDESGVVAITFTGEIAHDPTWETGFQALFRNAITAIN